MKPFRYYRHHGQIWLTDQTGRWWAYTGLHHIYGGELVSPPFEYKDDLPFISMIMDGRWPMESKKPGIDPICPQEVTCKCILSDCAQRNHWVFVSPMSRHWHDGWQHVFSIRMYLTAEEWAVVRKAENPNRALIEAINATNY